MRVGAAVKGQNSPFKPSPPPHRGEGARRCGTPCENARTRHVNVLLVAVKTQRFPHDVQWATLHLIINPPQVFANDPQEDQLDAAQE